MKLLTVHVPSQAMISRRVLRFFSVSMWVNLRFGGSWGDTTTGSPSLISTFGSLG